MTIKRLPGHRFQLLLLTLCHKEYFRGTADFACMIVYIRDYKGATPFVEKK